MKTTLLLTAIAGASAFAPASQSARPASQLSAATDLEGLRGIGPETGNQIVSLIETFRKHQVDVKERSIKKCWDISLLSL